MKAYISNLRNIATFSVVLLHVSGKFLNKYKTIEIDSWKLANSIDSSVRFCVPIFFMITGALLLNNRDSLKDFLTKRIKRIIFPLIFWTVIYFIWNSRESLFSMNLVLFEKFAIAIIRGASFHFWYIYTIIGLYLFIPIIKNWTSTSDKKELLYFLSIWFITLFFNSYTLKFLPPVELIYFSKYIGYLVAGYYLDKYAPNSKKSLVLGILLLVIGISSTYYSTYLISKEQEKFVDLFYEYATPNVAFSAIGIYLIAKNTLLNSNKLSISLDKNSFGIYFVHIIFLNLVTDNIDVSKFENEPYFLFLYIISATIAVYLSSYLTIFLLTRIKPLKRIIT